MTTETTETLSHEDRVAKLARDIAELQAGIEQLRAIYASETEPADAQTVELRVHASSKSSLVIQECLCDGAGACQCEIRPLQ